MEINIGKVKKCSNNKKESIEEVVFNIKEIDLKSLKKFCNNQVEEYNPIRATQEPDFSIDRHTDSVEVTLIIVFFKNERKLQISITGKDICITEEQKEKVKAEIRNILECKEITIL